MALKSHVISNITNEKLNQKNMTASSNMHEEEYLNYNAFSKLGVCLLAWGP